jgi:SAM-dependent methyltransferase
LSSYDAIAELYDPWSASVVEDVAFYLEEARRSGGPVVELGVGTGRIAVPIAADGIRVIGVDSSRGMLDVCARRAALAGVEIDLRVGDLREPPVDEHVPLVICPFRSLLHMHTDEDRLAVLAAAHRLLLRDGRFVFDVFAPDTTDIALTQDRWLEREPGIFEHAVWDEVARTLTLTVRNEESETTMALAWLSPGEWRTLLEEAGFEVEACYGWFDRSPYLGLEDTIWIATPRKAGV